MERFIRIDDCYVNRDLVAFVKPYGSGYGRFKSEIHFHDGKVLQTTEYPVDVAGRLNQEDT